PALARPAGVLYAVGQGRDAGVPVPPAGAPVAAQPLHLPGPTATRRAVPQLPAPAVDHPVPLQHAAVASARPSHGRRRRPAPRLAPAAGAATPCSAGWRWCPSP